MTYHARAESGPLIFILVLNCLMLITTLTRTYVDLILIVLQSVIVVFTVVVIFIRYEFVLNEEILTFRIYVFKLLVYKKAEGPEQIVQLRLKRAGWKHKCAIIKVKEGFNLRVVNFYPDTIFKELARFAEGRNIEILKTKDYKILER